MEENDIENEGQTTKVFYYEDGEYEETENTKVNGDTNVEENDVEKEAQTTEAFSYEDYEENENRDYALKFGQGLTHVEKLVGADYALNFDDDFIEQKEKNLEHMERRTSTQGK